MTHVLCRDDVIHWKYSEYKVAMMVSLLSRPDLQVFSLFRSCESVTKLCRMRQWMEHTSQRNTLLHMLQCCRGQECKGPKDKIHFLLGIAARVDKTDITVHQI